MTREQFIETLRWNAHLTKWDLTSDQGYLRDDSRACPVCYIATKLGKNRINTKSAWWEVCDSMGLSYDDARIIANAADGNKCRDGEESVTAEVRKQLLEACKLH